MFFFYKKKLTILGSLLVPVTPLVSALTINTPTGVTSGGTFNLSWVTAPGDPYVNQTLTLSPAFTVSLAPPGHSS